MAVFRILESGATVLGRILDIRCGVIRVRRFVKRHTYLPYGIWEFRAVFGYGFGSLGKIGGNL